MSKHCLVEQGEHSVKRVLLINGSAIGAGVRGRRAEVPCRRPNVIYTDLPW
jgi:hypothetical protein